MSDSFEIPQNQRRKKCYTCTRILSKYNIFLTNRQNSNINKRTTLFHQCLVLCKPRHYCSYHVFIIFYCSDIHYNIHNTHIISLQRRHIPPEPHPHQTGGSATDLRHNEGNLHNHSAHKPKRSHPAQWTRISGQRSEQWQRKSRPDNRVSRLWGGIG